jgi:hypothetical protein
VPAEEVVWRAAQGKAELLQLAVVQPCPFAAQHLGDGLRIKAEAKEKFPGMGDVAVGAKARNVNGEHGQKGAFGR